MLFRPGTHVVTKVVIRTGHRSLELKLFSNGLSSVCSEISLVHDALGEEKRRNTVERFASEWPVASPSRVHQVPRPYALIKHANAISSDLAIFSTELTTSDVSVVLHDINFLVKSKN